MKRELLILRHAKSDWDASYGGDHERPLAQRGIKAARKVGRFLRDRSLVPDLIFTSSAVRAHTTVQIACEAGAWEAPIEVRPNLYGASVGEWLAEVANAPATVQRLLVAGHEPTCSSVLLHFTGVDKRVVTAAVAAIDVEADNWSELSRENCVLRFLIRPKELA